MNSPLNVVTESNGAMVSGARPFYWSVRRELWEYRSIYLVPLLAAAVFLLAFLISLLRIRRHLHPVGTPHGTFASYELSAALIMGSALLVGLYYALDTLYGERRDRSILFWKSLPVSDLTAVLAKLTIPLVIVPAVSFVITLVTQILMLLLSSAVLLGSGVTMAELWGKPASFIEISLILLYHIVLVHGLWYAPLYGWLLLVSAFAPRAPLVWAVLPPFVIYGVERIAFNSTYFLGLLQERFLGPNGAMAAGKAPMGLADRLIPKHFFAAPGLWIGLAVGAVFIAAAVRMRRYRGPI
jgi:ABC-2 type transport system permease protein